MQCGKVLCSLLTKKVINSVSRWSPMVGEVLKVVTFRSMSVLRKGEYDNDLGWPFEGDFAIELLNWRADKNHLLATVDFSRRSDPNGSYTSRVYKKEYTPNGLGTSHFIIHSSLLYDTDTNTEYLQDDCLRLRVVDVAVYSTPLLSKTPSWQDPPHCYPSQCVTSHWLNSPNASSSTMSTTVHHSTHTHMGTRYVSKCLLMVMVRVKALT